MADKHRTHRNSFFRLLILLCGFAAGCATVSENGRQAALPAEKTVEICHGYGCKFRSKLVLGATDARRFASILDSGKRSPRSERTAIAQAVRYFEQRTLSATGVRDEPRSKFGASGVRGQMDCIDELTNTRTLLAYLAGRKLLRHHTVGMNASRGFLVDGRYPHSTAVVRDPVGVKWAVDSLVCPDERLARCSAAQRMDAPRLPEQRGLGLTVRLRRRPLEACTVLQASKSRHILIA